MNCRHADVLLQRALDGTLTEGERRTLDTHLEGCAACRAAAEEYRQLTQRATAWTRRPAQEAERVDADAFTAQVLARIAADTPPVLPARERTRFHPVAVLGCALVVLALLSPLFGPGVLSMPSSADLLLPRPQAALSVPGWLWANLRALPGDAFSAWTGVQSALPHLAGLREALVLALLANGLLFFHATRQPSRKPLAR